jgi:hypothetical protein
LAVLVDWGCIVRVDWLDLHAMCIRDTREWFFVGWVRTAKSEELWQCWVDWNCLRMHGHLYTVRGIITCYG